jgi:hypothetical protein
MAECACGIKPTVDHLRVVVMAFLCGGGSLEPVLAAARDREAGSLASS